MKSDFNIAETMSVLLNPATVQKKASVQSAEDAVASLSAAAEILDNMGLFVVAEAITQVMESVPGSLHKEAQTYGHSVDKYVLETLYDGLMAIRSRMSDIQSEAKTKPPWGLGRQRVTDNDFEKLSKIEDRLGEIQTYMEGGSAPEGLSFTELGYFLGALRPFGDLLSRYAKTLWSEGDKLPGAVNKLHKVDDMLWDDNSRQELSRMMRGEEEETGKDYGEPTVEFEQLKEHEYMPEEPDFEEDGTLEGIDELWDMSKEHPSHPLYRD